MHLNRLGRSIVGGRGGLISLASITVRWLGWVGPCGGQSVRIWAVFEWILLCLWVRRWCGSGGKVVYHLDQFSDQFLNDGSAGWVSKWGAEVVEK